MTSKNISSKIISKIADANNTVPRFWLADGQRREMRVTIGRYRPMNPPREVKWFKSNDLCPGPCRQPAVGISQWIQSINPNGELLYLVEVGDDAVDETLLHTFLGLELVFDGDRDEEDDVECRNWTCSETPPLLRFSVDAEFRVKAR